VGHRKRMKGLLEKFTPIYQRSDAFWPGNRAALDKNPAFKQAELPEKPGGEELDVHVVHLNYRDQAGFARELLDAIGPGRNDVQGKAEQVLAVCCTSDGSVLSLTPPPGRRLSWLRSEHEEKPADELPIDRLEGD